MSKIGQSEQH